MCLLHGYVVTDYNLYIIQILPGIFSSMGSLCLPDLSVNNEIMICGYQTYAMLTAVNR